MIPRRKVLSVLKYTALALLTLIVSLVTIAQIQQRILRWRAERLLADMQAIELHKTTWDQAQVLMHRWGGWGHYDGTCTAENCKYTIILRDPITDIAHKTKWNIFQFAPVWDLYSRLGWRAASFQANFLVQDGAIRRTFLAVYVDVPKHAISDEYDSYFLIAVAQSRSSLNSGTRMSHWIFGQDNQLAEHPYYKAGQPSGCENCMAAGVTYALDTPPDEIRRLTSFDLSCLTRLHPCMVVEELVPAAKSWHLHDWGYIATPRSFESCKIPLWALGRDATSVAVVDALSVQTKISRDEYEHAASPDYEIMQARFEGTLKGKAFWPQGTILTIRPYSGNFFAEEPHLLKHAAAGKRYLALMRDQPWDMDDKSPGVIDGVQGILLDHCGFVEDTPQSRQELQLGFAENDPLRVSESFLVQY